MCRALIFVVLMASAAARAQTPPPAGDLATARAAAEHTCAAHDAACDWLATFTPLERQSIERALAARGYTVEPQPWDKLIARVDVYNENVFAEDNWLQVFNVFHYTTRESAVRGELTIGAGHVWDDELVAESARRLRDPLYTSVVALLPVKSTEPGGVDLLVVTRDIWSIRLNTQYTFQEGSLTNLTLSLSENNFLGYRNVFAAALTMDQGAIAVGPLFIDKNLFDTHMVLQFRVDDIFTRQALPLVTDTGMVFPLNDPHGVEDGGGFHNEGSDSTVSLQLPLWSLASEWGWGTSFSHSFGVARAFLGTGIRDYDDPATPQDDLLPREYELKLWSANANVVRQWGTWLKQQLAVGYTLSSQRPSVLDNFPGNAAQRADFIRNVLPRNEFISQPYIEYSFYLPRYEIVRNIQTYELAEDLRVGPSLDVSLAQGLTLLGSDFNFQRPTANLGWTVPWCRDGSITPSVAASIRIQDGATIDNTAGAALRITTPIVEYTRLVAQLNIDTRWHDTQNAYYSLGSDSGLRGYAIGQFIGERRIIGRFEARTVPLPWWVFRVGAVAFYEIGGAANSLAQMPIFDDVGFGVRALIPQTSRELFRFDLAFPLQVAPGWPAYVPHPILSFDQAF